MMKKNISELKPYQQSEKIYGVSEGISDLAEKIRESGVVITLIITEDNVIISGSRRWEACKQLAAEGDKRFCQVNCEIKNFDSEEDKLECLLASNIIREKTMEQRAREAQALLEAERLRFRKKQTISTDDTFPHPILKMTQAENERTRDTVAKKLHMKSGHEVDRLVKSIKKIDELKEQGRSADSELICTVLNNTSPSSAAALASHIDEMSEEDKQAIRDKKISAHKAVKKYAISKAKPPDITDEERDILANKQACKEAVDEYIAVSMGIIDVPQVAIENRGKEALSFLNTALGTFSASLDNLKNVIPLMDKEEKNNALGMIISATNKMQKIKKLMEEN